MKRQAKLLNSENIIDSMLFKQIRELIITARNAVVRNINTVQVITSFEIGRRVVEHEQQGENRAEYGKTLLKDLSNRLTEEFGKGFSRSNLQNMRNFYLIYRDRLPKKCQMASGKLIEGHKGQTVSGQSQKTQTASAQSVKTESLSLKFTLSWSQYILLIGIKDEAARSFYETGKRRSGDF